MNQIVPYSERKKLVAQALRAMADRLENSGVCSRRMESLVEVMYPSITLAEDGKPLVARERRAHWDGIVAVELPEGVIADEDMVSYA